MRLYGKIYSNNAFEHACYAFTLQIVVIDILLITAMLTSKDKILPTQIVLQSVAMLDIHCRETVK